MPMTMMKLNNGLALFAALFALCLIASPIEAHNNNIDNNIDNIDDNGDVMLIDWAARRDSLPVLSSILSSPVEKRQETDLDTEHMRMCLVKHNDVMSKSFCECYVNQAESTPKCTFDSCQCEVDANRVLTCRSSECKPPSIQSTENDSTLRGIECLLKHKTYESKEFCECFLNRTDNRLCNYNCTCTKYGEGLKCQSTQCQLKPGIIAAFFFLSLAACCCFCVVPGLLFCVCVCGGGALAISLGLRKPPVRYHVVNNVDSDPSSDFSGAALIEAKQNNKFDDEDDEMNLHELTPMPPTSVH